MDLGPRYEHIRELGRGGNARIYLVRDAYLKREVALKLLHAPPVTEEDLEQVQKEFALLAGMEHPGIARALDFGYIGGRPFFTSEFVPGVPLSRRSPEWKTADLVRLLRDLAEALAFLHRNGILHLDVKASNVILCESAARQRAVLIDFGLFRRGLSVPTGVGIKGSLPYMAPEYFRGGRLGPWTDVYALGVTLYRVATGRFPRAGAGARDLPPEDPGAWDPAPMPPSELCPASTPDLDQVAIKCLALDPSSRYSSGEELLETVGQLAGARSVTVSPRASITTTVGRTEELSRADRFLDGLLSGRDSPAADSPASMLVTGPPGMGQTHFLQAIKIRAQTRGFRFYLETGYPGRLSPPGSLLRALGAHVTGDGGKARVRWESFLNNLRRPRRPFRSDITEGERRLRRAGEVVLAASSIEEPVLLAVDGLQFWDEVSIELLTHLVRSLGEAKVGGGPPLGVIAGFREEGTSSALLRELSEYLLGPGRAVQVTLGPLNLRETQALFRQAGGQEGEGERGLALFQATGGCPQQILRSVPARGEVAAGEVPGGAGGEARSSNAPKRAHRGGGKSAAPGGETERDVLLALEALDRPAGTAELARLTGLRRGPVARALERLESSHRVARVHPADSNVEWHPGPAATSELETLSARQRSALEARIAERLARDASGDEDPRLVEAVQHFREAGRKSRIVEPGLRAGAYLKSVFQHRAALAVYRSVFDALPARQRKLRLEVAIEMADLYSRMGDVGTSEGIRMLREVLSQARDLRGGLVERVLLRLATLHSRRGDFRRAEVLFSEGLESPASSRAAKARTGGSGLSREELLLFTNEHAAMKAVTGRYEEALALCAKGLRLAGRDRHPEIREVVLNLHATRANISLRNFDFAAAARDLEKAVEIAEAIGSPANQATLLNNLGVVYSQWDRIHDAIAAFLEAEKACLRLDEGPSLASIYGNLAILHAKTGDFAAMEKALDNGARLLPAVIGRRQEFFLQHARGLCLMNRGRYAAARTELEAALRLGRAIGDRHVVQFDEVYQAECFVLEGEYARAEQELERLSTKAPDRVRRMALARRAYLCALLERTEEVKALRKQHAEIKEGRPVPSLDAWDELYLGWALSLSGLEDRGRDCLSRAEAFFRSTGLRPALGVVTWIQAEGHYLDGHPGTALELLESERRPAGDAGADGAGSGEGDLTAALRPLLECRILLDRAGSPAARTKCADRLAEAGAALVGNRLREWSSRVEALRAALRSSPRDAIRRVEKERAELARGLGDDARRAIQEGAYWRAWSAGAAPTSQAEFGRDRGTPDRASRSRDESTTTATRTTVPGHSRRRLVARSASMQKVVSLLDRLREVELPVLIVGETGTGKELVARVLHEESRRAGGPFSVVDCATIPPPLLESELFGARAGAFTGIERDRPGMLALAARGTVLIDEIAGVVPEIQSKLLRVLSSGRVRPVGADEDSAIDVRFLFSTSRDLDEEVRQKRFRVDLYHRIRGVVVEVPPLRDRPEDLEELAARTLARGEGPVPRITSGALEKLRGREWPGNVRELANFLEGLRLHHPEVITAEAVDLAIQDPETLTLFPRNLLADTDLPVLKERLERDYIVFHYRRLGGDTRALSRFLGLSRRQLYRRCSRLGILLRKL